MEKQKFDSYDIETENSIFADAIKKADFYLGFFEAKKRKESDDEHFYTVKDSEELTNFIRELHYISTNLVLPNDTIYKMAFEAFYRLANCDKGSDFEIEIERLREDCHFIYYSHGLKWLCEFPEKFDEIFEELSFDSKTGISNLALSAMNYHFEEIFYKVCEFCSK